jgi:hypothetical protein
MIGQQSSTVRESLLSTLAETGYAIPIAIFVISLSVRVLLFYTIFGNERHGSAFPYASAAIGLFLGEGLTINDTEAYSIESIPNNYSGNYLTLHTKGQRTVFTEFLPGPPVVLAMLWKIIPVYNFAPYILIQCLLDAGLITIFFLAFVKYDRIIALITTALMIVNVAVARRTVMVGYDFWPQFAVMVTFLGALQVIEHPDRKKVYFLTGLLTSLTFWFRDITTLLPFALAPFLFVFLRRVHAMSVGRILTNIGLYLVPILLSLALVSMFRYQTTGNYRPTRSTFWHSFMVGVGQFSNPYKIESTDSSVWKFGKSLNKDLQNSSIEEMYKLPNSPYEVTLKEVSRQFVTEHPWLFVRNTIYRVGIMISPFFYAEGDFFQGSLSGILLPLGILLFPLWFMGMFHLYRTHPPLFWVSASIYLYFFVAFGWFYVVGRVILPYLFVSIFVYLFGVQRLVLWAVDIKARFFR